MRIPSANQTNKLMKNSRQNNPIIVDTMIVSDILTTKVIPKAISDIIVNSSRILLPDIVINELLVARRLNI